MSPLPERISDRTSFTQDREFINKFFNDLIDPDKIWRLHAYDDSAKQNELCKYMGVNFDSPLSALESYTTGTKGHELTYHKIYVTNKKGVYLDLQTDAGGKTKKSTFVRLGKDVDEGYIASLRNE